MSAPIIPLAARVARALRFYHEPEVFLGVAVSSAWPTDSAPPDPNPANRTLGWVTAEVYTGTSLSSGNAFVKLLGQAAPFADNQSYRVTVLSGTTYEVRRVSDNVLMGTTPLTTSTTPNTTAIPGLALTVSGSSLVAGDTYVFHADGFLCFKKADQVSLVVQDSTGTITYNGAQWLVIDPANALAVGAYQVYVHAELDYTEVPVGITYHQVGLLTGLTRTSGLSTSVVALTPSQVTSTGLAELVDNKTPQTRDSGSRQAYKYLLAF